MVDKNVHKDSLQHCSNYANPYDLRSQALLAKKRQAKMRGKGKDTLQVRAKKRQRLLEKLLLLLNIRLPRFHFPLPKFPEFPPFFPFVKTTLLTFIRIPTQLFQKNLLPLFRKIQATPKTVMQALKNVQQKVIARLIQPIKTVFTKLTRRVASIVQTIVNIPQKVLKAIVHLPRPTLPKTPKIIQKLQVIPKLVIEQITEKIQPFITNIKEAVTKPMQKVVEKLQERSKIVQKFVEESVQNLLKPMEKLRVKTEEVIAKVHEFSEKAKESVKKGAEFIYTAIIQPPLSLILPLLQLGKERLGKRRFQFKFKGAEAAALKIKTVLKIMNRAVRSLWEAILTFLRRHIVRFLNYLKEIAKIAIHLVKQVGKILMMLLYVILQVPLLPFKYFYINFLQPKGIGVGQLKEIRIFRKISRK